MMIDQLIETFICCGWKKKKIWLSSLLCICLFEICGGCLPYFHCQSLYVGKLTQIEDELHDLE